MKPLSRVVTPTAIGRDVPMSFSNDLLAAILEGRKTETRRPMRPQPTSDRFEAPPATAGDRLAVREPYCRDPKGGYAYQRDGTLPRGITRWTPARFMPRDAMRLFLPIVSVDASRLSAIDAAAARVEGFVASPLGNLSERDAFLSAWDTFYGDSPFAAAKDPWVWIIRFRSPANG